MIARVPPSRKADIETGFSKGSQPDHFSPRPAPDMIFAVKRGPWRNKSVDLDVRPETRTQIERVWFCEEGHIEALACGVQKGRGDYKVAEAPQFNGKQSRLHSV